MNNVDKKTNHVFRFVRPIVARRRKFFFPPIDQRQRQREGPKSVIVLKVMYTKALSCGWRSPRE
jgi:hypothetical protein